MIDYYNPKNRHLIRWYCSVCDRVDPRHPDTKPEEINRDYHTRPESMGNMYTKNICKGLRVAQVFNQETRRWENVSLDNQ